MDGRSGVLVWFNRLVSEPFNLSHFLIFSSCVTIRDSAALVLSLEVAYRLIRRELGNSSGVCLSGAFSSEVVKEKSREASIADIYFMQRFFGVVDLGLFPNAAEKFGISVSGGMSERPTHILFDNAVKVARFLEFGSVVNPHMTKKAPGNEPCSNEQQPNGHLVTPLQLTTNEVSTLASWSEDDNLESVHLIGL